ncbi:MAG: hypothetical protein ACE5IM_08915, partial [Nitrospinota bacterium]
NTVSDPFGLGWNLFGTAHFSWKIKWTPDSAGVLWVVQTGLIVAGHIFSIWSAHKRALAWFKTRGRAVRVEFPMAGLMVAYTVISLWIISRPVLSKPLVSLPGISP